MSTMREVGDLAGVSAKTVSRVINNDRYVTAAVRSRVEQAIRDLDYVPNSLARTFRTGRDAAIGIAVPEISDPFFATLIEAVEHVARERHAAVFVTSLGTDPHSERPAVEALLGRQIAGLITTPVSADQSYLQAWRKRIPIVFIDRQPGKITADYVVEDDHGGAHAATTHLIQHGHRRIGFIGDTTMVATTARRFEGYEAALQDAGIPRDHELVSLGATSTQDASDGLRALLAVTDPPTAVLSSNARCSIAVIPPLHAIARTDIAFISFGDFPLADALAPAISVIDQDPGAVGTVAATRLFERITQPGRRLTHRILLPVHLVTRASCCGLPSPGSVSRRTRGPLQRGDTRDQLINPESTPAAGSR